MSAPPIISIITPSYNQAEYLEDAICSVLAQATNLDSKSQIEYLVVDGGSTDGSLDVIQRYADQISWWISEPDCGQANAINKGIRHSRGEILGWLNSDDIYLPGAISGAIEAFQKTPQAGLIYADAISMDVHGKPLNRWRFGNWGLDELMRFRIICQPAVFFRRSVIEKAIGLDEQYHTMLDHKFWLQIARHAPIQHIDAIWAAARLHPRAKNVTQAEVFSQETFKLLDWMKHDPILAPLVQTNRKKIEAGAFRLSARYLLDGDMPGSALKNYSCAILRDPAFALKHWHRMIYALLSLIGGKHLSGWYYRIRRERPFSLAELPALDHWPGIHLPTS